MPEILKCTRPPKGGTDFCSLACPHFETCLQEAIEAVKKGESHGS